jgi:16S rRNA (guanine527-N7)-methyltransferase
MSFDRRDFDASLTSILEQLGLQVEIAQINSLYRHFILLQQWNNRINLSAVRDPREIVVRHFGESLAVGKLVGAGAGAVVDIGSGGGFPGVPVAVLCPDRQVTLVESVGKKGVFLKEIARELPNLLVFVGRLEQFQGNAEWVTMRGVSPGKVAGQIARVAPRVALLVSSEKVSQAVGELGLVGVERVNLPWDRRTVLVSGGVGGVPRGTGTQ